MSSNHRKVRFVYFHFEISDRMLSSGKSFENINCILKGSQLLVNSIALKFPFVKITILSLELVRFSEIINAES